MSIREKVPQGEIRKRKEKRGARWYVLVVRVRTKIWERETLND